MLSEYDWKVKQLKRCAKKIKNGCARGDQDLYGVYTRNSNRLMPIEEVLHTDALEMVALYYHFHSWQELLSYDLADIDINLIFKELGIPLKEK